MNDGHRKALARVLDVGKSIISPKQPSHWMDTGGGGHLLELGAGATANLKLSDVCWGCAHFAGFLGNEKLKCLAKR